MIPVIDVSHHQPALPWQAFADAGIKGAIVRVHNGGNLDRMVMEHAQGALAVGMNLGLYWYVRIILADDPKAAAFRDSLIAVSQATAIGIPLNRVLWMADIERNMFQGVWDNPDMTPEAMLWVSRYLEALSDSVFLYGGEVYMGPGYKMARNYLPIIAPRWPQGNNAILNPPREWEAITKDWPKPKWPLRWAGWQFTSTGRLSPYTGNLDWNLIKESAVTECWGDQTEAGVLKGRIAKLERTLLNIEAQVTAQGKINTMSFQEWKP